MKILVISRNAWDDTNAIGNTLSNFFEGIDGLEFANIYFREANPGNALCTRYYRVTEAEVLKKWFVPEKIGKGFTWTSNGIAPKVSAAQKNEKRLIRLIQSHNIQLAYQICDGIWYTKKWLNQKFRDFVEDFQPDLMVTFVKSAPQYYLTIKYLRENYHIPLFSWIADDEYTTLVRKNAKESIENLRYIIRESAMVRGCSQPICDHYNAQFGCAATPLYKGCELPIPVKDRVHKPIQITYAGNLLYGRLETIEKIAECVERMGEKGKPVVFTIFSNTLLSPEETRFFRHKKFTLYMGQQSYPMVKQKLAQADVVVHAESFEEKQIIKTKYSFSTKIIDCLQSGSVLLTVGPKELASVAYAKQIPGSCVIDDLKSLQSRLEDMLSDEKMLVRRAEESRAYAKTHHDKKANAAELKSSLERIMKKRG